MDGQECGDSLVALCCYMSRCCQNAAPTWPVSLATAIHIRRNSCETTASSPHQSSVYATFSFPQFLFLVMPLWLRFVLLTAALACCTPIQPAESQTTGVWSCTPYSACGLYPNCTSARTCACSGGVCDDVDKPIEITACICEYTFQLQHGSWGSCSASCGAGSMTRSASCFRSDGQYSRNFCSFCFVIFPIHECSPRSSVCCFFVRGPQVRL
jgi:hypothetical protein